MNSSENLSSHSPGPSLLVTSGIFPQDFANGSPGSAVYLEELLTRQMAEFFGLKGLAAIKSEDQREAWYDDWVTFQSSRRLFAQLLTPQSFGKSKSGFDLVRYARFLEVCAYFSPSHGYCLHVTFLGLCAILMGKNEDLKREAIAIIDGGGLLAFGISERAHGSDLLGNEFTVAESETGRFCATGSKYYIGNANIASIIAILANKESRRGAARSRRAAPLLFAFRPAKARDYGGAKKIRTLGVRSAFVGEFEVKDHPFSTADVIAGGREAWEAIFGTVSLGKFFLGFGSIGICEHAFTEASAHLRARTLYGKAAIEMPHVRAMMTQAFARLTAMKLYAYRALDYFHASGPKDQRHLLFAAVQKARLSTEGVKVVALLSECIGARGFESQTYFEMALRDVQLIPGLEGSTHINLGLIAQMIPRYFGDPQPSLVAPPSLIRDKSAAVKDSLLLEPSTIAVNAVGFPHFLDAYRGLMQLTNVQLFVEAVKAFQQAMLGRAPDRKIRADTPADLAMGQCQAIVAYAQLVAENAELLGMPDAVVSVIFHALVADFAVAAMTLAAGSSVAAIDPVIIRRMMAVPQNNDAEWSSVADLMTGSAQT